MRYFIGFMLLILLLIFLIILIITRGNDSAPTVNSKPLASYASTDAEVSFLNEGQINAASLHQQILITVDNDYVVYKQLVGYDGQVVTSRRFANTQNAYYSFLTALDRVGFTQTDDSEGLKNSTAVCPLGQRYIFEMEEDGEQLERSWATSCGGAKSYLGSISATMSLFQAQVPNYSDLSSDVQL